MAAPKSGPRSDAHAAAIVKPRCGPHILLVDAQPAAFEPIGRQLQQLGYQVTYASDGEKGAELARRETPVLVIMDLMQPESVGFDLCRTLRREQATAKVPIIIASASADETNRVVGLELGADDFVTKPFSDRELMLRITKLLGWAQLAAGATPPPLRFEGLMIDLGRHVVSVNETLIELTATEFRLLKLIVLRNGIVQRRGQLFRDVWNFQPGVDSRTLDTHVRRLRRKLGVAGRYLETVRGVGYRFQASAIPIEASLNSSPASS